MVGIKPADVDGKRGGVQECDIFIELRVRDGKNIDEGSFLY